MKQPQVHDRFGLVYGILMVLGIGTLLPWNVFITEKEFFDIRLHVEPSTPSIANNYLSLFGLVFNGSNLVALCVIICLQSNLSLRTQILNPLVLIFIVLASTAALALQLDLSGTTVAYYSLPALAVLGMCMAVLQGGVLNLASLFPPIYIQGFVVGAGLSGCATSLLSFFSQLEAAGGGGQRTPADVAPAAFVYFGAAAAISGLCILCFSLLTRLKYSRTKLGPYLASRAAAVAAAEAGSRDLMEQLLPTGSSPAHPDMPPSPRKNPDALPTYPHQQPPPCIAQPASNYPVTDYYHSQIAAAEQGQARTLARDYYLSQAAAGQPDTSLRGNAAYDSAIQDGGSDAHRSSCAFLVYALSILLTMGCSLAVWPGVTAFICSVDNPAKTSPCAATGTNPWERMKGDLFVPITFVVFGVGDLLGRIGSSWGPWGRRPPPAASLLVYAIARCAIAGSILFCHVVTPTEWQLPTLFKTDYYPMAFITLLGLTQGHLLSTACMHAPAVVPPGKEGEFGPVTGFCITAGCLLGSSTTFFLMEYLTAKSAGR